MLKGFDNLNPVYDCDLKLWETLRDETKRQKYLRSIFSKTTEHLLILTGLGGSEFLFNVDNFVRDFSTAFLVFARLNPKSASSLSRT